MKVFNSYVFLLLLLLTGSVSTLSAQNRTVSGKVLDALQEPLIGVSIVIDGTAQGSITDVDGAFELQIPAGGATLNFSYVGYLTEKVKVKPGQKILWYICRKMPSCWMRRWLSVTVRRRR